MPETSKCLIWRKDLEDVIKELCVEEMPWIIRGALNVLEGIFIKERERRSQRQREEAA